MAAMLVFNVFALPAAAEAEPESEDTAPVEISTAEELAAVADDLSADYVLTADIDLAGLEWSPLGTFVPVMVDDEMTESPDEEYAFTGTFDGAGYTISNLSINAPEDWAVGLFGCLSNASVGNFTLKNASVTGTMMAADVVGYAFNSEVYDVELIGGTVTARFSEMGGEGMYAGVVGAGFESRIEGCSAEAVIIIPDNTANAGIIGGGLEQTSVVNSKASGVIIAGDNCYGLGGISGCGFGAEEFTDCEAKDVIIIAGEGCFWIGGITGYAGGYQDEAYGVPVTVFTKCCTENMTVITGEDAEGVSDIVGAGFYNEEASEAYGAPYDQPTEFELVDCEAR